MNDMLGKVLVGIVLLAIFWFTIALVKGDIKTNQRRQAEALEHIAIILEEKL